MGKIITKKIKIVSFDLEVSPALGRFYPPLWETRILKLEERQKLMSFAYQIVGEKKIISRCLADLKGYKKNPRDDKALVKELHEVMSNADVLLGQNSDQFDVKMANYFFVMNGLSSIPPKKQIDTKKIAKRYFRFPSNKLDDLGEALGVGKKTKTTHSDLWEDCYLDQDLKAWKLMNKYCEQDVRVTTAVYLKLRPFMRTHPNIARMTGDHDSCPTCGLNDFTRVKAYRFTNTSKYTQYVCTICEEYFTDRKAETEKEGDTKPQFKL